MELQNFAAVPCEIYSEDRKGFDTRPVRVGMYSLEQPRFGIEGERISGVSNSSTVPALLVQDIDFKGTGQKIIPREQLSDIRLHGRVYPA
jgi:hypothetical protein